MAPKNPAKSSKKASNDEDSTNEDYRLKRDRNNLVSLMISSIEIID